MDTIAITSIRMVIVPNSGTTDVPTTVMLLVPSDSVIDSVTN